MLFSNVNATARNNAATGKDAFPVILFGRFMRADYSEHVCRIKDITPHHAVVLSDEPVEEGEHIVAYVDEIGRLEGNAARVMEGAFELHITTSEAGRERLAAKIDWVKAKAHGEGVEKRRYERYKPKDSKSSIELEDGRSYPCEVIDISVSGASVRSHVLPAIGTPVKLGKTRGRVVRHHAEGFAIEFYRLLPEDILRARIG